MTADGYDWGAVAACDPIQGVFIVCVKTRDNGRMPMVPTGLVHQTQLTNEIAKSIRKLGKEVVRVNYSLGTDSTGEPSIFFRIVLTDAASREDKLAEVTGRIETILFDEIRPCENWGFTPILQFPQQVRAGKTE
jgi:hypothetical protein